MSSKKGALIISLIVVLSAVAHAQLIGSTSFVPSNDVNIPEELYDLEQKAVNMQEFLSKLNKEFADMKSIVQQAIDEINAGNFAEASAHLETIKDYIDLIDMQKADLHQLVNDFQDEGEGFYNSVDDLNLPNEEDLLNSINNLDNIGDEIHSELNSINSVLEDGGFEAAPECGSDLTAYINCALGDLPSNPSGAISFLEDFAIPALNDVITEKNNIETQKVNVIISTLNGLENSLGQPVPPPFNPNTLVFKHLREALFDVDAKGDELESILVDMDDELVDIRDVLADAKKLVEEGIELGDSFEANEKFKAAIRLIQRAETIKHIINGPFKCLQADCTICGGEDGCPDGIKVQEFEELKSEIEDELNNDVGEGGDNSISILCSSEFIDGRRCDKFFLALSSLSELLSFINSELSTVREILVDADGEMDNAASNLEDASSGSDGESADSALNNLDDAADLIEQAIIRKEFIEHQKLDKFDFFLNQIIEDVGTSDPGPLNEIVLGDVKKEWFNIQVKLLWLNDLLKGLNVQIGAAEDDLNGIVFLFQECVESGEPPEECPDSPEEFAGQILNKTVNSIVRVILSLVDIEEITNLIDDIRSEKSDVENQINDLCKSDVLDNDRLCDKLQRKLTGMNKALDFIDEELEETVDDLGDSLSDLFNFLFFILGEIGILNEQPPEISTDNYVQVIDQLYQTLGQAVSNGIPAQSIKSIKPAQFEGLEDALDSIHDAKSIKETIELHKFPVLFERFRSFEETIGGSVKPEPIFEDTDDAEDVRHIQTKVLKMFSLLHLINVHAAKLKADLLADEEPSEEDFTAINTKLGALEDIKSDLESEINDLESEIIEEMNEGNIAEVTGNHILRNIDKIQSLSGLINIEFFIMEILLDGFSNTCCGFESIIFLDLFIAEKEAIEVKKLPELEASLVEIENALLGCDDDDHDQLFENPFCFRNCGFEDHCGDGKVQFALGEQCDDGNKVDDDACTNDCKVPACGDGIVQAGEECDDGNVIDFDGCSSDCLIPDPDGDGICDEGDSILPCQFGQGCENDLDCGLGGACGEGCFCPGLKCQKTDDCVGKIDCSAQDGSGPGPCSIPGNCEFCSFSDGDVGECACTFD